jgi:hypothetical protein
MGLFHQNVAGAWRKNATQFYHKLSNIENIYYKVNLCAICQICAQFAKRHLPVNSSDPKKKCKYVDEIDPWSKTGYC